MTTHANGTFDVKITPQEDKSGDATFGKMMLEKQWHGDSGEGQLNISVVPDSGTEELQGLTGKMMIKIENGKHFYEFDYTLPGKP